MTNCTKIYPKLVYSQKLGYITGSILSLNEVLVSNIDEIHAKICLIYEKNAIAIQIQVIILKIYYNF